MSDRGGIGQSPRFSDIYQQFKSDVPVIQDREHVRARGNQLYLRSGWEQLTTTEPEQERQERLQSGASFIRESIDRQYGPGVADVIFARMSSAGVNLDHGVTRGDLEQIHGEISRLHGEMARQLDNAQPLRAYGDNLILFGRQNQPKEFAWERRERLQAGSDYVRDAIDREHGTGLGRAIFSSLSGSAGHDLRNEVTRGDLEQINSVIGGRKGEWDRVTAKTLDETSRKIAALSSSGLRDVSGFAKELAELRDNAMWGDTQTLQKKWDDLRGRVDEACRKSDLVLAHNRSVPELKAYFEETVRYCEDKIGPGNPGREFCELETQFLVAAGRVRREATTNSGDNLGRLRDDAFKKAEELRRTVDIGQQAWDAVSLDATRRKIELLRGWSNSTEAAGKLKSDLDGLRAEAISTGTVDKGALQAFQQRVDTALDDWTKVHRHNAEMLPLRIDDDATAHIRQLVDTDQLGALSGNKDALSNALARLDKAKANAHLELEQRNTDLSAKLDGLRKEVRDAANEVKELFQAGLGDKWPDYYFEIRTRDLLKASAPLFLRAEMMPNAGRDILALEKELDAVKVAAKAPELSAADRYQNAERAIEIANKLIAIRSGIVAQTPSDGGSSATDLALQVGRLTEEAQKIASIQRTGINDTTRSDAALKALTDAPNEVLDRLGDDTKLSLLESLYDRETFPKSGKETKDDPLRAGLRKLYEFMKLAPDFVTQDNALRQRAVDALVQTHGKEFQYYRDNWSIMTTDQRHKAMQQALEAHCGALGVPVPKLVMGNALDNGSAGHYDPKTQSITIATSSPAFRDFETMMDTIFHENTHHYQDMLPRLTDNPVNKAFSTQVKTFEVNMRRENAYIKAEEGAVDYRRQPIEAHAWWAGSQATSLLLQRLDALRV